MSHGTRSRLWLAAETVLAVVIVVLVVLYFAKVLDQMPPVPFAVRVELLVPAGALYLLAHLCWSTFWVRLLRWEGVRVSWGIGLRTYYISQFGKYIPGKVWVLGMRVGMLRRHGGVPILVGVTAIYETLTSMSAGALLAVLFLPAIGILPPQIAGKTTALFAVVALPLGLGVLNQLVVRITRKRRRPDARPLPAPPLGLLVQGLVHGACGYGLLALSLDLTVRGLVPNAPEWSAVYTTYIAALALSYVVGFVAVVAPGGLGVREFVLAAALVPTFAPVLGAQGAAGMAVVIALTLRLTWTIAEVVVGLLLYAKRPALPPPVHID